MIRFWLPSIGAVVCSLSNIGCVSMESQLTDLGNYKITPYGEEAVSSESGNTVAIDVIGEAVAAPATTNPQIERVAQLRPEPVAISRPVPRPSLAPATQERPTELIAIARPSTRGSSRSSSTASRREVPRLPEQVVVQTSDSAPSVKMKAAAPKDFVVKTTAYTHTEADSLEYGLKTARGDNLKFGNVRSAAADWSRYPVGTRFRIKGLPYEYIVDDYGSALVGTDTIDLYKPDHQMMNDWGARQVGIEVIEWGSFKHSQEILQGRINKVNKPHLRVMLRAIEQKMLIIPKELQDGFAV